ncbi:MAG: methyl-accepting chemotaxis protein [Pseudomonadota bacterium]
MSWKNVSLRNKILAGSGFLLLLFIGNNIWSIKGINTILDNGSEVIEGNKLRANILQREVEHLKWVQTVGNFITDDRVNTLDVQTDPKQCAFGKWYYGQGAEYALKLLPGLALLLKEIEQPHIHLHESAQEIALHHQSADTSLPAFFVQKELEHMKWSNQLLESILQKDTLVSVQIDPHKCNLGIFIYSDNANKLAQKNDNYSSLLSQLEPNHMALHDSTQAINQQLHQKNYDGALQIYQTQTAKALTKARANLKSLYKLSTQELQGKAKAEQIFSTKTQVFLAQVQDLFHQMNDYVNKQIMTDQQMFQAGKNTREDIYILSVISVVIGILISLLIARSIVHPLLQILPRIKNMSNGDLTDHINLKQEDEVGQLASTMEAMREQLHKTVSEVKLATNNIAQGSNQLSQSVQELSSGASKQAASIEETSSSLEQMSANVNQSADNAMQTEKMATAVSVQALEGGKAVKETVSAMKEIADKISIIEDIAYQTNLLALNAAIEAARAGNHGKGFAVVATEVRKLAARSEEAAGEISNLAKSSVAVSVKAGELLDEIVPKIQKTADLVQEISAASDEQASGINEINDAMAQLDTVTQNNAALSEELASTSEEMSAQTLALNEMMAFFILENSDT